MEFQVVDRGVVLEPSLPGETYYEIDGGGVREGIVNKIGDTYYMFYDGAAAHSGECKHDDPARHLWRACLAKSRDMVHWEKLGVRLRCGYDDFPESNADEYLDFWSASSPWVFFDKGTNRWHMYYLGAKGAAPSGENVGTPSVDYNTLYAYAETEGPGGIEGNWIQENRKPGKHRAVCFCKSGNKAVYPYDTTSPGSVIENPDWEGPQDTAHKKYMMFFTSGFSIGIARTDDLAATQDFNGPANPNGWVFDGMALGRGTLPENAHYFYDEKSGLHFLFCNQIAPDRTHADAVRVYWSKSPENWDDAAGRVIIDHTNTKDAWATGAIGMPSAAMLDDNTLGIIYDAAPGGSTQHLNRKIGLAYFTLPR